MRIDGDKVHCYATPTRERAQGHPFYGWVFNGEKLYERLAPHYPLFDGERREGPLCLETFPHAVMCALAGRVVPAKPKNRTRRAALREHGYDDRALANLDLVDAALCALAARSFAAGRATLFGDRSEGFIVVPGRA